MTEKTYELVNDLAFDATNRDDNTNTLTDPLLVYADASPIYDDYDQDDEDNVNEYGERSSSSPPSSGNDDNQEQRPKIDIYKQVPDDQKHLVDPALMGGAVLGMVLGGPLISLLLGFGSAYAIRKQDTPVGNIARGLGEITQQVQDKTIELETKHQYGHRLSQSVNEYCEKRSESSFVNKTRTALTSAWNSTVRYTRDNQLIERGVEGTGRGMEYASDYFSSSSSAAAAATSVH